MDRVSQPQISMGVPENFILARFFLLNTTEDHQNSNKHRLLQKSYNNTTSTNELYNLC